MAVAAGCGESNDSSFLEGSCILCCEPFVEAVENVCRSFSINFGTSRFIKALLIELRLKMLPKLPATTRGIFFARIAVAACSLEEPQPEDKNFSQRIF